MAKLVLFMCLALAIACAPTAQGGILGGITDRIESIQKDVTQKVNDAIAKIESIVADMREQLMQIADRITDAGNKMVESMVNKVSETANQVNDAIAEARAKGIDIGECAQKHAILQKTIEDTTDATAGCVNEQVQQTKDDMNEVIDAAAKTISDLRQVAAKLSTCGLKITCYLECATEASIKSVGGIADISAKAYAIKTKLEQRMVTLPIICGQEILPRMIDTISTQGKETMDCIASKTE